MNKTLHNYPLKYTVIRFKPFKKGYTKKAPVRLKRVSSAGAFKLPLTMLLMFAIMPSRLIKRVRKELTRMKVIKKSKLGLVFDISVASFIILLNELAAFLYIRDNIKEQDIGYGIAAFSVFCSTYIVFKLIARLVK